jgi:nucleotide-binding universal stress UspA family protein
MNQVLDKTETNRDISSDHDLNIRQIVVAVDLSPHSEKTAAYAVEFARSFEASVTLVHVFAPERITEFTTQEVSESFEEEQRATQRKLRAMVDSISQTYAVCSMEFCIGDPAEEVNRIARERNADLIVTASHHPGFLGRLFGLDQAPRIVHRAGCPVLVYHEGAE